MTMNSVESHPVGLLDDGSRPMSPEELLDRLAAEGFPHRTIEHAPVFTVEESKALRGNLPGGHTKNLFLRNKKGAMWLVTCEEDRAVDLKAIAEKLDAGRFSFCSAERLMRFLGVPPGSVTPLALVNDHGKAVQMVIDATLLKTSPINVHPLTNSMTTALEPRDLLRFLESTGHPARILDLDR